MNNSEYWANRFKLMEEALNDHSAKYVENLEKQFDIATAQLDTQIRAWYQRFADNNGGMTYANAQKLLTSGELEEFKWSVERYIEIAKKNQLNKAWAKQLENASARVHISRLESIKMQIRQLAEELTQSKIDAVTQASKFAYTESYYHTAFEVQRGIGFGWTMQEINTDLVKKVLSKPWTADNQTFTARCWTDKSKLVEAVNRELTIMTATGEAPDKAIKAISKQFNVSKSNAGRLVMTESAYFSSAAQKDCFNNLGVEQYEIIGTLDASACAACGGLDGKVFSMNDFKPGTTAPPFHPRCRCCTAPYFEDIEGVGERAARDDETGKTYYVPSDMEYNDWKEKYVKDAINNLDEKLYEKYKIILGDNIPSIEKFIKIRYNNSDWNEFEAYASSVNSGELSAFADFNLYQNTSREIDSKLLGIVTINNITITGKSKHCIARVIGSVEQRRNGVQVSGILDALTNPKSEVFPVRQLKNGRSQKFRNEVIEVSINPDTGNLIQVNPVHSKKKVKL